MRLVFILVIVLLFSSIFISCRQSRQEETRIENYQSKSKESLVVANKYLTRTEDEEINNYIQRHDLKMVSTGSGLRYSVLKSGAGPRPKRGDIVTLDFKTRLITGDIIYSSEDEGPMVFEVGKGGIENGLEEAILQLHLGDQAVIILPSHLAFGLLGDQKKIPQRATVIYEIDFIKLSKKTIK
jgi:FKBP-type peptidyl-prolyl cis-trans isomerase